jgi:hypothetical protein
MLSTKIRTVIISSVAAAALSVPGVASAALLVRSPGTVTQTRLVQPTVVAKQIKEAGSTGVAGYDNAKCESLLHDYNTAVSYGEAEMLAGKNAKDSSNLNIAKNIYTQMSENCLLVD